MKRDRAKEGWRPGEDFRVICTCQVHARRQRVWWRRGLRNVRNASTRAKSGMALLVGLPIAFGATWVPMEGMTGYAVVTRKLEPAAHRARELATRSFHVFTTDRVRRNFLAPHPEAQTFSLEISKEAFFRAHVPYGSIIYREARRNNLQPELVAAVVESESDFRPRLQSNKNAQGLMQIVPETGRLMGAENLFNPEDNIAAGTKYLRYLFDRFGDEKIVLAAYNAGEGNIERFGGVPPFQETLTYLQRVAQRRGEYTQRVHGNYMAASRLQKSMAE
jgi:soluble lytic murein transglycosylase-like protein